MNHVRLGSSLSLSLQLSFASPISLKRRPVLSWPLSSLSCLFAFSSSSSIGTQFHQVWNHFNDVCTLTFLLLRLLPTLIRFAFCLSFIYFGYRFYLDCPFATLSGLRRRHMMDDLWIFIWNDEWLRSRTGIMIIIIIFCFPPSTEIQ